MGPMGRDPLELPEEEGWWWQVLSGWSRAPVVGSGGADREALARHLVEEQMAAASVAALGVIVGPRGQMSRCMRTVTGGCRWLPETPGTRADGG